MKASWLIVSAIIAALTWRDCAGAMAQALAGSTAGRPVFNVADYGAKNDGSANAAGAFKAAIAAAEAAGGGTVFVPAGHYTSGPIELASNITFDVNAGATIAFPVAPLPIVKGRYLGVEALVPMPLIGAHDAENVTITGRGTLTTGDYAAWSEAYGVPALEVRDDSGNANGPHWDHLLKTLEAKHPVTEEEYQAAARELRPSFICFQNSKNVLVEGVRVIGGPAFVIHLLYTENATVRDVMVEAYPGPHANGIVVDSSRFVRIADDYIDTGDDGIVIKAGKDADGLRVNRPCEDVAITNCTVHHAHGAVVIGSETSGSIRNVVASNITAMETESGIRIKSRRGRGGVVEDVRFDNWTMEDVGTGIVVTSYYVMGGERGTAEEAVSERTPVFRNIAISNVTVQGAKQVADIEGLPEMPVDGLRISGLSGSGHAGLLATYTHELELHDAEIEAEAGPAFVVKDGSELELDDVNTRTPRIEAPVIQLEKCTGVALRDSRAFPGTKVFVSIGKGETGALQLIHNDLKDSDTPVQER